MKTWAFVKVVGPIVQYSWGGIIKDYCEKKILLFYNGMLYWLIQRYFIVSGICISITLAKSKQSHLKIYILCLCIHFRFRYIQESRLKLLTKYCPDKICNKLTVLIYTKNNKSATWLKSDRPHSCHYSS